MATESNVTARLRTLALVLAATCAAAFTVTCNSWQKQQTGRGSSEEQQLRAEIEMLTRKEQALTVELSLARRPDPYLAVDLVSRKIALKIQSHRLRGFPIAGVKMIGGAPTVAEIWVEKEAEPLETTARAQVVPGSGEASTSSVATRDPWGPRRMPADFDLICQGERVLEIRSLPSEHSHTRVTRWLMASVRQAQDWARTEIRRRNSAYRQVLKIWLAEDDARLLFWSLPKQIGILVLNAS
jgi:hypothetical protein